MDGLVQFFSAKHCCALPFGSMRDSFGFVEGDEVSSRSIRSGRGSIITNALSKIYTVQYICAILAERVQKSFVPAAPFNILD